MSLGEGRLSASAKAARPAACATISQAGDACPIAQASWYGYSRRDSRHKWCLLPLRLTISGINPISLKSANPRDGRRALQNRQACWLQSRFQGSWRLPGWQGCCRRPVFMHLKAAGRALPGALVMQGGAEA